MALINVHIFTYAEMLDAINQLNTHYGLPVEGGQSYFSESSFFKTSGDQYYIPYNEEWTSILGTPITINLPDE